MEYLGGAALAHRLGLCLSLPQDCALSVFARASGVVVMMGVGSWVAYRLCRRYLGPRFVRSLLLLDDGAPTPTKMKRRASLPELRPKTGFGDPLDIFADDEWSEEEDERPDSAATDTTWLPFETTEVGTQLAALLHDQSSQKGLAEVVALESSPRTPSRLRPRLPPSPLVTGQASPVFRRRRQAHQQPPAGPDRLRCCAQASPSRQRRQSPFLRSPACRTSALDIGEAARACATDEDSDWSTASPPPIRRCSGSVASASLWEEPLFSPPVEGEEEEAPLLSDSEALRQLLLRPSASPAPSEMSIPVETAGLGNDTHDSMAALQGHIASIMQDSAELSKDLGILSSRLGTELYPPLNFGGSEIGSEASFDLRNRSDSPPAHGVRAPIGLESLLPSASPPRPVQLPPASSRRRRAPGSLADAVVPEKASSSEPEETPRLSSQLLTHSTPSSSGQATLKSSLVDSAIWTDPGSASDVSESAAELRPSAGLRSFGPSLQVTPEEPSDAFASPQHQARATTKSASPASFAPSEMSLEWDLPESAASQCPPAKASASESQPSGPPSNSPWGLKDLRSFARESLAGRAAAQRVLESLASKERLRSVCLSLEGRSVFPGPAAILAGVALAKRPIFQCSSFEVVAGALAVSGRRYSFLAQWPLHSALLGPGESVLSRLEDCLRALWSLQEQVQRGELSGALESLAEPMTQCAAVEGLKLLMWLRAVEVYEELRYTRQPPRAFYASLFRRRPPALLMAALGEAALTRHLSQLEMALLADALGLRLHVFDLSSERPHVAAVYPDKAPAPAILTLVQPRPNQFLPLSTLPPLPDH